MLTVNENKKWFPMTVAIVVCLAFGGLARASWVQQQKLTALDGAAHDLFGFPVRISGNYAIVGAYADYNYTGSAYIFYFDGTNWTQQQKLAASDRAAGDYFGQSVSISGNCATVGAFGYDGYSGSAYIFYFDGTSWVQEQKLLAPDGAGSDWFGYSVSVSGNYAIVGAPRDDDKGTRSGSAYIFYFDGTNWVQQQKLTASDGTANDVFGCAVSISGDYAIVGAYGDDDKGTDGGSAYIFYFDGTSWTQQVKVTASDGAAGDHFGEYAVSISGSYAIVGARYADPCGTNSGSAYIFYFDDIGWTEQQKLTAWDGAAGDEFGLGVCISGDSAIVGAWRDDVLGLVDCGSVYIFYFDGTSWVQEQKLLAPDGAAGDYFGVSVCIRPDNPIVGAYRDDDRGHDSGSAYVFTLGVPPPDILTLLDPYSGEVLVAGSTCDITWVTKGIVEYVFIEYSTDSGSTWTVIDMVPNTGSYQWEVPEENSQHCLVCISDGSDPAVNDVSDAVFRIYTAR